MAFDNTLPVSLPYETCSLEQPGQSHFCQMHQDEQSLTSSVVRYLKIGAMAGDNLVLVSGKKRQALILSWLEAAGINVKDLLKSRRLFLHSSVEFLRGVLVDGMPDPLLVESTLTEMLDKASREGEKRVRIYGDAVSDLWASGMHAEVIALEECITRFRNVSDFDIACYCGYIIDALSPGSYSEHLCHLGRPHGCIVPSRDERKLVAALDRAGRETLGVALSQVARRDPPENAEWIVRLPDVFRNALWLIRNEPATASSILARARMIYLA